MRSVLVPLLLTVALAGCRTVNSNLPAKMTRQIQRDYHCDEMHGEPIGGGPDSGTWSVDACGRRLVVTCPEGPHSRWRRCAYGEMGEDPEARGRFAAPARRPSPSPAPAVPELNAEPGVAAPGGDETLRAAESQARAQIDAHAAAVLACNAGQPVAMDLGWDAGAAVTLSLVGPLAGTPTEGCVRDAVGDLVLPAGAPGQIRHVVAP